ncbi:MAG TPA: DUF1501 domain-containing protein [Pirellulales bacterium]|nr:DUF1501 domain-containing protein [Pirellulales bacterium]
MPQDRQPTSRECSSHFAASGSRRDFLARAGGGFGSLALALLMADETAGSERSLPGTNDLAGAKRPHFTPRATNVIWCFLDGGPSHLDLFDPKPQLDRLAGQPLPASFERPITAMGRTAFTPLLASKRTFAQHGQSGLWVSDWYPEIATCADDLALIRSCHADALNHVGGICQMNTGSMLGGRPSLGAWCLYGLGTQCEDLPGYVVLADNADNPPGGNRNWGTGFMPAAFQGTKFRKSGPPILHLAAADDGNLARQRSKLDFLQQLNQQHLRQRGDDDYLEARIASYELAFRMQSSAPRAIDLADESAETRALYGLDQKDTHRNGMNCLLARRLVERGVRCVQLYMGSGSKWDAHSDVEGNHALHCRESDRPIAGLLKDLKRRGLLETTLVIWGGEFGRTPMSESGNGRDHNPYGFSMWMAGGGIKPGVTYGATDDIGLYAVENKAHVNDIHATILHLLGLDHEQLTLVHNGRAERLTNVAGKVIQQIVA